MTKARFITKWRYEVPGNCPVSSFQRIEAWKAYEKSCGVRVARLENELPMDGLIQGSYETDNKHHIEILLTVRGPVKLENPQAVVDLGVKTVEEMKALGFDVEEPGKVVEPPKAEPPKAKEVDFDTIDKSALMRLASEKGIRLDGRLNKNEMVRKFKADLAKLEG